MFADHDFGPSGKDKHGSTSLFYKKGLKKGFPKVTEIVWKYLSEITKLPITILPKD